MIQTKGKHSTQVGGVFIGVKVVIFSLPKIFEKYKSEMFQSQFCFGLQPASRGPADTNNAADDVVI